MEALKEKFQKITTKQALLISLLFGGFYYTTSFDDGSGLDRQLASIQKETVEKTKIAEKTRKQLENARQFEKEVNEVTQLFAEALEFLPMELNEQQLREEIINKANLSGASVREVRPQKNRVEKDKYEELYYVVELRGTFGALTTFLSNITSIKRLINIRNIKFLTIREDKQPDENVRNLDFKAEFVTYRYVVKEEEKLKGRRR